MYQLQVNDKQLDYIKNACEYLGRHLIGQPSFIPLELEEWTEDKQKIGQTILDMRKVIMHEYCKNETGANVHQYDVYKMGQEPLMEICKIVGQCIECDEAVTEEDSIASGCLNCHSHCRLEL